ncbi:MAG: hypothetical protein Q8Q09_03070 [Deltaproteobacteria bacterium]|nr:hypothetical protein [Deltaproteobacteria bacterium]
MRVTPSNAPLDIARDTTPEAASWASTSVKRLGFAGLFALLALSLGACAADAPAACVPGDLVQCRCIADNTYGYRTCDRTGHYSGPCDCVLGLSPDAGRVIGYTSGGGGGGTTPDASRD